LKCSNRHAWGTPALPVGALRGTVVKCVPVTIVSVSWGSPLAFQVPIAALCAGSAAAAGRSGLLEQNAAMGGGWDEDAGDDMSLVVRGSLLLALGHPPCCDRHRSCRFALVLRSGVLTGGIRVQWPMSGSGDVRNWVLFPPCKFARQLLGLATCRIVRHVLRTPRAIHKTNGHRSACKYSARSRVPRVAAIGTIAQLPAPPFEL
jgi:hypothetical protein